MSAFYPYFHSVIIQCRAKSFEFTEENFIDVAFPFRPIVTVDRWKRDNHRIRANILIQIIVRNGTLKNPSFAFQQRFPSPLYIEYPDFHSNAVNTSRRLPDKICETG